MDYKHIEILPLYSKPIDLRQIGTVALLCGWGTVSQDDVLNDGTGDAQYLQNLHCVNIELLGSKVCKQSPLTRDFKAKVICGYAIRNNQNITLVILYFGNKLTRFILSSGFHVMQLE